MDHYYIVEVEYQGVTEQMLITAINGSEARRYAKDKFRKERSISTQSYVEAKIIHESTNVDAISAKYMELTDSTAGKVTARFELHSFKQERKSPDTRPEIIFNTIKGAAASRSCHEELIATRRVLSAMVRQFGGYVVVQKEQFNWESEPTKIMYIYVDPLTQDMHLELKERPSLEV